jgi:chromosome segregation ATPase
MHTNSPYSLATIQELQAKLASADAVDTKLCAEIELLTADRDEWKDSTISANQNAASEEARRRVMQMERDELHAKLAALQAENATTARIAQAVITKRTSERNELRDKLDRCKLHLKHIGNDALRTENEALQSEVAEHIAVNYKLAKQKMALEVEVAEYLKAANDAASAHKVERDALRELLSEVSQQYTRDDDLPDNLLPRIDAAIQQGEAK